jgi:hypothetical protein
MPGRFENPLKKRPSNSSVGDLTSVGLRSISPKANVMLAFRVVSLLNRAAPDMTVCIHSDQITVVYKIQYDNATKVSS